MSSHALRNGSGEAQAIENLREMQSLWLQDCVENGHDVPAPARQAPESPVRT
jgi:predicted RNase H-like HicB family nuclease